MATKRRQTFDYFLGIMVLVLRRAACSPSEPTDPALVTSDVLDTQADLDEPAETAEAADELAGTADELAGTVNESAVAAVPERTLTEQVVTSVVDLQAGQQVEDIQGNLIVMVRAIS